MRTTKSEVELMNEYPDIHWLSPLSVAFARENKKPRLMYACRFCIVQQQLGPHDIYRVSWDQRDHWFSHQMAQHRPLEEAA